MKLFSKVNIFCIENQNQLVYQPLVGFSRNDGVSGSDVPSDEEEDDESDIVEVNFFLEQL